MTIEEMLKKQFDNKKNYLMHDQNFQIGSKAIDLYYSRAKSNKRLNHFIKCFMPEIPEKCACYTYFDLSESERKSKFIGMEVKPEFYGLNLGMFLFSMWVKTCLEADSYSLQLQRRQTKPGIIYIAKKFGFEIKDANARYANDTKTIFICTKEGESKKALLFKDPSYQAFFQQLPVSKHGHNKYIDPERDNYSIVDKVLLNNTYWLDSSNRDKAYDTASRVLTRFK